MRTFLVIGLVVVSLPLAAATVGEPFTLPIELAPGERFEPDSSADWELVTGSREERVTVRAFRAGEISIEGTVISTDETSRRVSVPVVIESVLVSDDLEPSPLADPVLPARSPLGWIVSGLVGLAALLLWVPLFRTGGEVERAAPVVVVAPREEFFDAIDRARKSEKPLAAIADATRRYLSRVDPKLARDLTSFELMSLLESAMLAAERAPIRSVLDAGDLEKFSPWGSDARVEEIAGQARRVAEIVTERGSA